MWNDAQPPLLRNQFLYSWGKNNSKIQSDDRVLPRINISSGTLHYLHGDLSAFVIYFPPPPPASFLSAHPHTACPLCLCLLHTPLPGLRLSVLRFSFWPTGVPASGLSSGTSSSRKPSLSPREKSVQVLGPSVKKLIHWFRITCLLYFLPIPTLWSVCKWACLSSLSL